MSMTKKGQITLEHKRTVKKQSEIGLARKRKVDLYKRLIYTYIVEILVGCYEESGFLPLVFVFQEIVFS